MASIHLGRLLHGLIPRLPPIFNVPAFASPTAPYHRFFQHLVADRKEGGAGLDRLVDMVLEVVDGGLATLARMQTQQRMTDGDVMAGVGFLESRDIGNGSGGLVTPPSLRSLGADSNRCRYQPKEGSRGRSGSRSHCSNSKLPVERELEAGVDSDASSIRRPCSPSLPGDSNSSEADANSFRSRRLKG